MTTAGSKTEKQVAGAGYILSFFNEIDVLTQLASTYINNIIKMKVKYGNITDKTKLDPADQAIITSTEQIKGAIFRTYVKFTALKPKVREFANLDKEEKGKELRTVEKLYHEVRDSATPNIDLIEEYTLKLNTLFVEAIEILTMAEGIYTSAVNAAVATEPPGE